MELKILQDKDNQFLNRKEILAEASYLDKTPSNQEMKKELASHFKTKEDLVVIQRISQLFGKRMSKVEAKIYKDEKSLKECIKEKKQVEKKEEKPKEQPKEEKAPAEKSKEKKE